MNYEEVNQLNEEQMLKVTGGAEEAQNSQSESRKVSRKRKRDNKRQALRQFAKILRGDI